VSLPPTSICLTCRTALARGEPCDGGSRHRVVDLETVDGREAHLHEVWGPSPRQQRLRQILGYGVAGGGLATLMQVLDCGDIGPLAIPLVAIAVVALLFGLVGHVVDKVRDVRRRRRFLRPYGAATRPRVPEPGSPLAGIAEGTAQPSPLRREPCLASSIVLRSDRPAPMRTDVLWREQSSDGFIVRLDDGGVVRIPAGRVRIVESRQRERSAPRAAAAAMLPGDLGADIPGELRALPFDSAWEQIIRPEQRVAILSPTELREDPDHLPASPRAPANVARIPVGVPVLKCLDSHRFD